MDHDYAYIADILAQLPDIPADSIVSRTLFSSGQVKVVLFGFAAGQELSEHTASQPAMLHILQGKASLTLGKDSLEATAGTWVHMPAQLPHSVLARDRVVMLLLLLKTGAERDGAAAVRGQYGPGNKARGARDE